MAAFPFTRQRRTENRQTSNSEQSQSLWLVIKHWPVVSARMMINSLGLLSKIEFTAIDSLKKSRLSMWFSSQLTCTFIRTSLYLSEIPGFYDTVSPTCWYDHFHKQIDTLITCRDEVWLNQIIFMRSFHHNFFWGLVVPQKVASILILDCDLQLVLIAPFVWIRHLNSWWTPV